MKKLINTGAAICAVICLVITFAAAGFVTCAGTTLPTRLLAQAYVTDDISPYTHDELVEMAVAIRNYSFGDHDLDALNSVMDTLETQAVAQGRMQKGATGEEYRLDSTAISHLDDCYGILEAVRIPLIIIALLAIAATAHVGVRMGRRPLSTVLIVAGATVIALFALAGVAALINFQGFFALFHSLFFQQGSWVFWYKSLLICSLPEGFWMGMGIIWFATTALLSILSLCVGVKLRRRKE